MVRTEQALPGHYNFLLKYRICVTQVNHIHLSAEEINQLERHATTLEPEGQEQRKLIDRLGEEDQVLAREFLYVADEVFFTGTAVEVTPVRSIDRIQVGEGKPGPITRKLQDEFFAIVQGKAEDRHGWLTYVNQPVAAKKSS